MLDGGLITSVEELDALIPQGLNCARFAEAIAAMFDRFENRQAMRSLAYALNERRGSPYKKPSLASRLSPSNCGEAGRKATRNYYKIPENRERNRELSRYSARPEHYKEYMVNYFRERRANDPQFKIADILRSRLRSAMKAQGARKDASTIELTSCTPQKLIAHLESQFTEGMTWENQGEWHIDHIRPCASFDLTDPEQQRQCFHWTNLQPLWGADNIAKGARLDWEPES